MQLYVLPRVGRSHDEQQRHSGNHVLAIGREGVRGIKEKSTPDRGLRQTRLAAVALCCLARSV